MAVTKLKLLSISGSLKEFEAALYMCVSYPFLHIEDIRKFLKNVTNASALNEHISSGGNIRFGGNRNAVPTEHNPYAELLSEVDSLALSSNISLKGRLKKYEGADAKIPESDGNNANTIIQDALALDINEVKRVIALHDEQVKKLLDSVQNASNLVDENERILEQTEHLANINIKMGDLFSFEYFKIRFGHLPKESYNSLHLYTKDADDFFFIPSSATRSEVWGLYITPKSKSVRIDSLFSALHFERVRLSDKARGTPSEVKVMLTEEIETLKAKIKEDTDKLNKLNDESAEIIEKYYEKIFILDRMFEVRKNTVRTSTSFHLIAWIPELRLDEFTKRLETLSTIVAPVNSPTDIPDLKPPTLLKNFPLFKPFEQFVTMYGLPAYREIDPTPFVAITYILFYGIMFADLGQGAVLFLAGAFLWFFKKMNFGKIGMCLGVSSMCFGVYFGSVFGMEDLIHGYNPIEHINEVLIAAVVIGALTISAAIILNIANGIRQKNIFKAVFSQNGLAGLIFYWSVIIAALVILEILPIKISAAAVISLAVLCIAVIYFREPLTHLCERKKKIIPENAVEFFIGNIFEVFEIILSFVTNTISFIRIGAFALSHVGMMSVVILLAGGGEHGAELNPVAMIIGNVFVMVLEGMLVGIQVLRLEFYEIFSRFFEGNGRVFEPSGLGRKRD